MGIVLFTFIISIFVGSRFIPKPTRTHKIAALAIGFIVIGDIFLVLLGAIPGPQQEAFFRSVCGMLGFLGAYITLTTLFTKKAARRYAIAGFFMFLSDMGVAFAMFYPGMGNQAEPLLENEIWITYVPAWSLVLINLLEEKLTAD